MPTEQSYSGVRDATTDDYLAGVASADLKKIGKDGSSVLAYPVAVVENGQHVRDEWVPVTEGTVLFPTGTRSVYVEAKATTGGSS